MLIENKTVELTVIIINWNSRDFLRGCLRSIAQHAPRFSFEVIVIDNASFDGSEEMVRTEFPGIRYIQSPENLGFSRGNNAAALTATGRNLLFLNPDTEVLGDALSKMKESLDSMLDAAVVGCRILNSDGSVQTSAVQAFPTLLNQMLDTDVLRGWFPRSRLWGTAALLSPGVDPVIVDTVSGACLMIRRNVFEQIGGFSTDYFMYSEDVDICHKVHLAGWKTCCLPAVNIIHFNGQSTKKKPSYFPNVMQQQSRFIYFSKMRGKIYANCFRASRGLIAVIRMAIIALLMVASLQSGKREQLRLSMGKWFAILKWSLGLKRLIPTQAEAPRPVASS
jgi:N-acetylglucosaminyl-diphospho-decaprenol L-rhamnosyltransferase